MAYEPTTWKDRAVERPLTFTIINNPDGTVTLVPAPGAVVEPGTPVNAANLNNLEQGLVNHEAEKATLDKLGHIKEETNVDGRLIRLGQIKGDDGNYYIPITGGEGKYTSVASDDYGGTVQAIAVDKNYVFFGGVTGNKIIKLDKHSFQKLGEIGTGGTVNFIGQDDDFIYFANIASGTYNVRKARKTNLDIVADSPTGVGYGKHIAVDKDFIYTSYVNRVQKLAKSNLSIVATKEDLSGLGAFVEDGLYIYISSDNKVYKLNKSDLSVSATSSALGDSLYSFTVDDTYIYAGCRDGKVYKLNKSNLSLATSSVNFYNGRIESMIDYNGYIYAAGYNIIKIDKSNLSKVGTMDVYGGTIYTLAQDELFIYVGGATVQKVRQMRKEPMIMGLRRVD